MNSVFHPTGKDPFQRPPLPQSHYAPSPSKEILDKSATLTPQKLKHRHEYSLPPEVYTPEQYSIREDDSFSSKPPLPSHDKEDIVRNLQKYLDDVESWDSALFCEKWPSKNFETKEISDPPHFEERDISERLSSGPLTSTTRSVEYKRADMREKPVRMKTSFASDKNSSTDERSSNIQMRLNRFRYGEPKAPEERRTVGSQNPTSSYTGNKKAQSVLKSSANSIGSDKQSRNLRSNNTTSPKKEKGASHAQFSRRPVTPSKSSPRASDSVPRPPLPPHRTESPEIADSSISTLESKLDRLLQESSSVAVSPLSTLKSTQDKSGLRVSSDVTSSSEMEMSSRFIPHHRDAEPPRKMLWQKENVPSSAVHTKPENLQKEEDILYQWRLKRKIELARENVARNKGLFPPKPAFRNEAERPFATEATEVLQDATSISRVSGGTPSPRRQPHTHMPSYMGADLPSPSMPMAQHHLPSVHCCPYLNHGCPVSSHIQQSFPQKEQFTSPEKKNIGVGVTEMVSIETQTGKSLIFTSDLDRANDHLSGTQGVPMIKNPVRSTSSDSIRHTSTPASSVSFHRVRIVTADTENSPQTTKSSPQARNLSPVSCKTDATTLWSSTDRRKTEENRSPVSSVQTLERKLTADSEMCSPTANVVKEVIGAHLFNTTRTPSSASAVSSMKDKECKTEKKNSKRDAENLNGSYTTSDSPDQATSPRAIKPDKSSKEERGALSTKDDLGFDSLPNRQPSSERPDGVMDAPVHAAIRNASSSVVKSPVKVNTNLHRSVQSPAELMEESESSVASDEDEDSDLDPDEMFEEIIQEMEFDEVRPLDTDVLKQLKDEKSCLLEEFREIEAEIEKFGITELDNLQNHTNV